MSAITQHVTPMVEGGARFLDAADDPSWAAGLTQLVVAR